MCIIKINQSSYVTSKKIPIANAIRISGTFKRLNIDAIKTIKAIIIPTSRYVEKFMKLFPKNNLIVQI